MLGDASMCVKSGQMLCVLCYLGQSPTGKKKTESKLKDAMSQSSDEREERDVGAGKHDSAVGLKEKKKKKKSPQRKGMQMMGKRAKEEIFSRDAISLPSLPPEGRG